MDLGLKKLLDAILAEPNKKLINRYLALIADYKDDAKKSQAALALAQALLDTDQDEAMRIAHMVYKNDRQNIAALDLVIFALKAKGRLGKATVLQSERDKLKEHVESHASRPAAKTTVRLDEAASQVLSLDDTNGKSVRLTELSHHKGGDDPENRRAETRLPQGVVAQSVPPESERRQQVFRARESLPIHQDFMLDDFQTQLKPQHLEDGAKQKSIESTKKMEDWFATPADDDQRAEDAVDRLFGVPQSPTSNAPPSPEQPRDAMKTPDKTDGYRATPPSMSLEATGHKGVDLDKNVASSDLGVAVEMFDYYWQQGFVDEARSLLAQTARFAGTEAWWQARNALIKNAKIQVDADQLGHVSFWGEINQELMQLSQRLSTFELAGPRELIELYREPNLPTEAWEGLLRLLRKQSGNDVDQTQALQFKIVNALWGEHPHPDCAHLLTTLALHRVNSDFWGIYLDSLLVGQGARKCLAEVREWLPERPRLKWCHTAYARLEIAWQRLKFRKFRWTEDDGVWPLLSFLNERPQPTLAGAIVVGADAAPSAALQGLTSQTRSK